MQDATRRVAIFLSSVLFASSFAFLAFAQDEPLWNIAWISDTQANLEKEWMTALINKVKENNPSMIIHTGDLSFGLGDQPAWSDVLDMMRIGTPPLEFHVAIGNHDMTNGIFKMVYRTAATQGVYPVSYGNGYASGPDWPRWNPDVQNHPGWSVFDGNPPYRYVFKRGNIRFIVLDCYVTTDQINWMRNYIQQPDDSSRTIVLQHEYDVDQLEFYFRDLEGKHNVALVLSGHGHRFTSERRHGVQFIQAKGMFFGHWQDSDAMTLWVYPDRLRLDRYVLPEGLPMQPITGPEPVWFCSGNFTEYVSGWMTPTPSASPTPPVTPTPTPIGTDTDGDGIADLLEGGKNAGMAGISNMYLTDSDGDGLRDGIEDLNRNGVHDSGETSPVNRDSDGDGYEDGIEVLLLESGPLNPDSPLAPFADADGDLLPDSIDPNSTSPDTDGDRFLDGYEAMMLGMAAVANPGQKPTLGDVDHNGFLDNGDAQKSLNFFASVPQTSYDPDQSDVDRNGTIDNGDAQHKLGFFAQIRGYLPIE